jgi:hypothetical protein
MASHPTHFKTRPFAVQNSIATVTMKTSHKAPVKVAPLSCGDPVAAKAQQA